MTFDELLEELVAHLDIRLLDAEELTELGRQDDVDIRSDFIY